MAQETDFTTDPFAVRKEGQGEFTAMSRQEAKGFLQDAKAQGKGFVTEQKGKAADIIDDLAGALHSSARQLNEQARPTPARYLDQAADSLQRFSSNLRQRDVDEMTYKFRDFARRQPIIVVAGTLIAGFYLARLMKSGSEQGAMEAPSRRGETPEPVSNFPSEIPVH
jgi:uncharacterized protein YjbJ (UPF0337 family)